MANLSSIARPYAQAAFESARKQSDISAWKTFLKSAAEMSRIPAAAKLLGNPEVTSQQLFDLFQDVLKNQTSTGRTNFLRLLAEHKRFNALDAIYEQFDAISAQFEKASVVRVVTAVPASDTFKTNLAAKLGKRMQGEVKLECEVDPQIIGGAIIYMGDHVIDGSVRSKLARLLEFSLR